MQELVKYEKFVNEGMILNNMGLMDQFGNVIVPPKYDYIFPFEDGLAIVQEVYSVYTYPTVYYGVIDETGKEVIPVSERNEGVNGFFCMRHEMEKLHQQRRKKTKTKKKKK